jgi:hypothetical protein
VAATSTGVSTLTLYEGLAIEYESLLGLELNSNHRFPNDPVTSSSNASLLYKEKET